MKIDISKFKLPELFNDSNGKTDASLVAGFMGCCVAMFGIVLSGTIGLIVVNSSLLATETTPIIEFCKELVRECNQLFIFAAGILVAHRLTKSKEPQI